MHPSAHPPCRTSLPVRWRRSITLRTADLPRCTRSYLFALQQAGFNQPLDGVVTDAAYSRSFAQTHSLRIVQSSFLTGNRMVTPGCRHTNLIPPLPFARGIAASVQHRGDLVVAVSNRHATNDLQRLHGRGRLRCGTWSFHRELRMRASLPVNHQLKVLFILVGAHNDLFDGGAEDHLLKCRRTVVALPDSSKVIAHRTYSDFLFRTLVSQR